MTSFPPTFRALLALCLLAMLAAVGAGCGGDTAPTNPIIPSTGPRPSSLATVEVVSPEQGTTVTGDTLHVVLKLTGATIVPQTTTAIRPDEGHVHLYVNNVLVSMNYGLEQDLPATPGSTVLSAEFVAADHAPFSPRVWSDEIVFTVAQ